jgi:NADH dehydrogenase
MDVVTGAFSYTGRWIADELLQRGRDVVTLSRSAAPTGSPIAARPLQFADLEALTRSLEGAQTLYNTYWIRFERGTSTFERAVANTRALFTAAAAARVRRVVHVSVTNATLDSPLPYFRGKAELEVALRESGLPYAIVRPTLVFGPEDILVNNIAWGLRRFPIFLMPGEGDYRVQPVSVRDTARIAVDAGLAEENIEVDAAGPETLTFESLVRLVRGAVGANTRLLHVPPLLALAVSQVVGRARRDVILTREELDGLTASLLTSPDSPLGSERFSDWVLANAGTLGRAYVSELARNFRPYAPL